MPGDSEGSRREFSWRAPSPVVGRRLLPATLLVQMLHSCGRVGGAPLLGFATARLGRSRGLPRPATLPAARAARTAPALFCSLRTTFPHGLHNEPAQPGGGTCLDLAGVLGEDNVHVWMVQTDAIANRGDAFLATLRGTLSEDEMQRYERSLATPKAREQALSFLVARSLLRCTLSRYIPQVAPACWRFEVNAHGRPSVCSQLLRELSEADHESALGETVQRLSKLRFNLSHCTGMVVCAFTYGREVGIDSEIIHSRRRIESIAKRFFSPDESSALLAMPEEARALTFSRLWTLKEAYVKARGLGISEVGLDNFEFKNVEALGRQRPTGTLCADLSKAGDKATDWQFDILEPPRPRSAGQDRSQTAPTWAPKWNQNRLKIA